MMYPALLLLMCTPRLPVVDWTDAQADLNGLVLFAERRNLFSARVPSHFKRSLPTSWRHRNLRFRVVGSRETDPIGFAKCWIGWDTVIQSASCTCHWKLLYGTKRTSSSFMRSHCIVMRWDEKYLPVYKMPPPTPSYSYFAQSFLN